ncbi:MAG: ATP-binding protein [Acidobacteriaceae bacterium]|nr:ATP-binding protein [Acidobacteriaceae bacterium]
MNLSQLNRTLLQVLLLPVAALLIIAAVFVWQIVSAVHTVERIQHADRNISYSVAIMLHLTEQETALRGYQITGNEIFLQPYTFAEQPLQRGFAALRTGLSALHESTQIVDRINADNQAYRKEIAEPLIAAVRAGEYTSDPGLNLREKARMDYLVRETRTLTLSQRDVRDQAVADFHTTVRHTIEASIGLAIAIGLMVGVFSRGQLRAVSTAFQTAVEALRRNALEASDSEQRLRTVLTSIADGVIVCDRDGRVEMLNTVAQELTGYSQAQSLRRPLDEILPLLHEETKAPVSSLNITAHEYGSFAGSLSYALLRKQDELTKTLLEYSVSPIFDNHHRPAGAVIVFRDITEQRQTQHALLASEKLAVAGRLAATIAHEIHNPLDAVINLLYLLRNNPAPEEQREFLDMASNELDRVAQISRAMLGMYRESKIPVAVEMTSLLRSLLLLLDHHLEQAGVTVETRLLPEATIMGYPAELRQVFTNLLTNALDVSPRGSKLIVSMDASSDPEGVMITVEDSGPGIPAEVLAHLFQPFFTTKGEQGTGLGLWVSRGIVEKHRGHVDIETSMEKDQHGTKLIVTLPAARTS